MGLQDPKNYGTIFLCYEMPLNPCKAQQNADTLSTLVLVSTERFGMSDLEESWISSTLQAVKYIKTCQGAIYRNFKENFPDFEETGTPDPDYLAWVWDWLVMNTPYEEHPEIDALVWHDADETDFLETEEKFTHRGRNDWN